jgi:O-antigen ligase
VGYTNTIVPRRDATGAAPAAPRPAAPKEGARLAYFFLLVFTGLLFGRPSDLIWSLQVIPMAQIAAVASMLAYLISRLQGRPPFHLTTELKLVFLLTALFVVGVPFSAWKGNSVEILQKSWSKTVIIFFLITQTAFTLDRVRKMLWMIIACSFLVSAVTLAKGGDVDETQRLLGFSAGIMGGNFVGLAVAITLPYLAALLVRSRSIWKTSFLIIAFGTLMWHIVRSASRGSTLCVLFSLALVWMIVLRQSTRARMLGTALAAAVFLAILLAPGVFWTRLSTLWDTSSFAAEGAKATKLEASMSEYQRKALFYRSIEMSVQHPVFGVGLGNFLVVSGTEVGAQGWQGTHNSFTQVSSEAGIPAFIVFVLLMVVVVRQMRKVSRECGDDPAREELSLFARATQVSVLAFAFGGFFAHLAYDFYLYYLVGIGAALQTVAKSGNFEIAEARDGSAVRVLRRR